jgi:hypothetical protein
MACGKHLAISNLQIPPLKIHPFLQKNRGPTETILHFFSRFFVFLGFFHLQAVAFQQQAATQPLSKKSSLKHYRRFYGCSGMCHNRRMNVEMTGRNEGCGGWTPVKRQPALMMKSEILATPTSVISVPFVPLVPSVLFRPFDETALSGAHQT